MNAEFNWWLLIVGVAGGAGLLWLVLGNWSRREEEIEAAERVREAAWIADVLRDEGTALDPATAETVLRLHRTWLRETGAYDPQADDAQDGDGAEIPPEGPAEPEWPESREQPPAVREPREEALERAPRRRTRSADRDTSPMQGDGSEG